MSIQTRNENLTLRIDGPIAAVGRITAVAGNTLREAGRNRLFYGLLGVTVLMLIFSILLSDLALTDQKVRLVTDFGLAVIPVVSVATAVLLGAVLLYKEIDRKTLYAILPKPIRRSEFLIGKFLGLCLLLLAQLVLLAACWAGVLALRGGSFSLALAQALGLSYLEIVLVTSAAMFFSALSRPVLSGVLTLGVFLVGRVTYVINDLMQATKGVFAEVPAMRTLGRVVVALVPDLSTFNIADELQAGVVLPPDYFLHATLYGLCWVGFFVALSLLVFERRDLV
jgi:ABC-type transport system involved in multi-copper enzyme maturation permease subunit